MIDHNRVFRAIIKHYALNGSRLGICDILIVNDNKYGMEEP